MNNEIYHHGTLGQRWGFRRYQNADGSLTPAGKRRYGSKTNFERVQEAKRSLQRAKEEAKNKKKQDKINKKVQAEIDKYNKKAYEKIHGKIKKEKNIENRPKSLEEMTTEEIRDKVNRMRAINDYNSLMPKRESITKDILKNKVLPAVSDVAVKKGKEYAENYLSKKLGLNTKSELDMLKETVDKLNYNKMKLDLEDYINTFSDKQKSDELRRQSQNATNAKNLYNTAKFFQDQYANDSNSSSKNNADVKKGEEYVNNIGYNSDVSSTSTALVPYTGKKKK